MPNTTGGYEELRQTSMLVQSLLDLPVHKDSSALKEMDAWVIAAFIRSKLTHLKEQLPEKLPVCKDGKCSLYTCEYNQGFNNALTEVLKLIDAELEGK